MNPRPPLSRNVPFWILAVGSLVLAGFGAWLVVSQLQGVQPAVTAQNNATTIDEQIGAFVTVSNSGPIVGVGAAVLTAGLFGLVLALAVAAISGLRPAPVLEAPTWVPVEDDAVVTTADDTEIVIVTDTEASADSAAPAETPASTDPETPTTR